VKRSSTHDARESKGATAKRREPARRRLANTAAAGSKAAPRHALRAWTEIARGITRDGTHALLLDFDGTLVAFRRYPEEVCCPPRTKLLLGRLALLPNVRVGMISGRRVEPLERLVGIRGLSYWGVCGAESDGRLAPIRPATQLALSRARRAFEQKLEGVRGMHVEDKGISFTVHFHGAPKAALRAAAGALRQAVARTGRDLRIVEGSRAWDVVPRDFAGKGAAVRSVMRKLPPATVGIYIGDDVADEPAFAALPHGITIRVGKPAKTAARYWLRNPAEVYQFLTRIEEALQ
jgi:trehalose 6-phosphate phosphatase